MARAIWTGSLSFGLVSVPVGLYSAIEEKTVRFHQFQAGTADRVRNKRVNERTGEDVEFGDIVKGYDLGGGEYVLVTPEELEAVEPEKSSTIEVTDFVDLAEIDPIYFQRAYFLAPQGEQARRAYALLLRVMREEKKVGVATFVMRNKEYLVSVRPGDDVLIVETMYFADEIREPREEIDGLPVEAEFTRRELDTAKLLVESMGAQWNAGNYADTYRGRVQELIDRKRRGEAIVTEVPPKKPAEVVDLADALQRSVEAARDRYRGTVAESPRASVSGARARGSKQARPGRVAAADLTTMSKSDLYELATELDVPRRSKMSRQDLERAVKNANSTRRKRAS